MRSPATCVLALVLLHAAGGCAASPRVPPPDAVVPFELWDDWIVVRAEVNGAGPYSFVVDTGAGFSLVSPAVTSAAAAAPPISRGKDYSMRGVGAATRPMTRLDGLDVAFVGGSELRVEWVAESPALVFDPLSAAAGVRIDGLLGFDLFRRYVVEVDYDGRVLRLYEPATYGYRGPGALVPIESDKGKAFIRARVTARQGDEPVDCLLTLDTGGGADVMFNGRLLNRHALDERVNTRPTEGVGIAGDFPIAVGRVAALQLGPYKLTDVTAGFARHEVRDESDGLLGAGVLRRFRVVVSYPHRCVILVPGRKFNNRRPRDHSGIALEAFGPELRDYRVAHVLPDSPATDAGVREGDEVVAVDGRPTRALTMPEVEKLLRTGGTRAITLRRAGAEIELRLRLRPLL